MYINQDKERAEELGTTALADYCTFFSEKYIMGSRLPSIDAVFELAKFLKAGAINQEITNNIIRTSNSDLYED